MSINNAYVHIAELGIWISKPDDGILSTYDKKMITRKRNQMIKSNPADVAKIDAAIAAAKTAAGAGTKIDAAAAKTAAGAGTKIDAAAAKTAAESVVYMMTESGQMVPIATK